MWDSAADKTASESKRYASSTDGNEFPKGEPTTAVAAQNPSQSARSYFHALEGEGEGAVGVGTDGRKSFTNIG